MVPACLARPESTREHVVRVGHVRVGQALVPDSSTSEVEWVLTRLQQRGMILGGDLLDVPMDWAVQFLG